MGVYNLSTDYMIFNDLVNSIHICLDIYTKESFDVKNSLN